MEFENSQYEAPLGERGGSTIPEFTVYDKPEYLQQLQELIPQAKNRVWVQTMTFDGNGPFLILKGWIQVASATNSQILLKVLTS